MNDTGIIILAAGSSSRLGKPKQLLAWQGKTLIEHAVEQAVAASLFPIVAITGAEAKSVSNVLQGKDVFVIHNEAWQEGMASGIIKGVQAALSKHSEVKNIITAVCDQPFVSAELFQQLVQEKTATGKDIVACAYANTIGTPVLFAAKHFAALQKLSGAEGAKKLLRQYNDEVTTIFFEKGAIDIDTEEDYRNLQTMQPHS